MKIRFSLILVASLFLLAAPVWKPALDAASRVNFFITPDSFVFLGAAFLAGLLAVFILPDRVISILERMARFFGSKTVVFLALSLMLIFAGLYAINRYVYYSFHNSGDEHACYFLAECLRMGKWLVSPHPLQDFFNVTHVGYRDGKWFSVYPFGWPLLYALGMQWKVPDLVNPLLSVLSLGVLYKIAVKLYGKTVAIASALILGVTPFFLFTSAAYFSHPTCLLMMMVFGLAFLKWQEAETEKSRILWAAILAAACGYGLATRYLTMAAFAAPFFVYRAVQLFKKKEMPKPSDWVAAGILLFFIGLVLYQNYAVTGKPFKAPNRYDKSWERLGFRDFYTPLDALRFLIARAFYLMDWAPPVLVLFYIWAITRKREFGVIQNLFRYAFLYPVFAYFFYFSWGGNQAGPRYYYEGFPFLVMTVVEDLRNGWVHRALPFRKFLVAVIFVSLITAGYQILKQSDYYEEVSRQRKEVYRLAEENIKQPAVVFLRGFLGDRLVLAPEDTVRNHPSFKGKIIYAKDMGTEQNQKLRDFYPEREAYLGYYDRARLEGRIERIE